LADIIVGDLIARLVSAEAVALHEVAAARSGEP
jgi:hypothetical protein